MWLSSAAASAALFPISTLSAVATTLSLCYRTPPLPLLSLHHLSVRPITMQQYQLSPLPTSGKEESAVLCRFPHGPPEQLLDPNNFSSIAFQLHQNRDTKSRTTASQRTLTATSPRVDYLARNYGDQSAKLNQYTYALGLVDERAHAVSVLPVSHVYSMAQHVKVRAPRTVPAAAEAEIADGPGSYAMRQKALIDSFGSKKRKNQLASKESNRVIVQAQTAAVLDAALQQNRPTRSLDEEETGEAAIMRQTKMTVLPPFDEATDEPMQIYALDRFIPPPVQQLLQAEVRRYSKIAKDEKLLEQLSASLAAEQKRNSRTELVVEEKTTEKSGKDEKASTNTLEAHELTPFILHRLQQLTFLDAPLIQRSCLLLVYYHLLLTLKLANPRQPRRALTSLKHRLPDGVLSHLLATFTQSTPADREDGQAQYVVDSVGKQRVLCHLLVCTLLLGGGRVSGGEVELVSEECKMGVVEAVGVYREVGAAKASRAGAELVAPLVLGRFKRRAKKARK